MPIIVRLKAMLQYQKTLRASNLLSCESVVQNTDVFTVSPLVQHSECSNRTMFLTHVSHVKSKTNKFVNGLHKSQPKIQLTTYSPKSFHYNFSKKVQ